MKIAIIVLLLAVLVMAVWIGRDIISENACNDARVEATEIADAARETIAVLSQPLEREPGESTASHLNRQRLQMVGIVTQEAMLTPQVEIPECA